MTMDSLPKLTLTVFLILAVVVEKTVPADPNPCETSAPGKCQNQNFNLVNAVQSNDANIICQTYHGYRDCLYQHSTECRDTDFVGPLLDRACSGRCFDCGGAGIISGSLSTVTVFGILVTAYLMNIF